MLDKQLKFLSFVFERRDINFENPPMTIRSGANFYIIKSGLEMFLSNSKISDLIQLVEEYNNLKDITQFILIYGKDPFGLNDYDKIIQEVIERISK